MKRQLHWSQIAQFTRCPEQFRRRYVLGESLPPTTGALIGTAMHRAAEVDLKRKMDSGALAPIEEVVTAARDVVSKAFDSALGILLTDEEKKSGLDSARANTVDMAVCCAAAHHARLAPLAEPVMVERRWTLELESHPFDLAGTIDCDENGSFWDWKTAARSPSADEADLSGQLTMYSMAKAILDEKDKTASLVIPEARLGYVVKTKFPKTLVLRSRRTHADFEPFMRTIERIAGAIDKESYTYAASTAPRPWWCSAKWCGYHSTCDGVSSRVCVAV